MEPLHNYLNKISPISDDVFEKIKPLFNQRTYEKKTLISNIGENPKNIYLIKSGIIRAYTIDDKGKEYTKSLFRTNQMGGAISALITKKPSKLAYETVTHCEILEADFEALKKLSDHNLEAAKLWMRFMETFYLGIENKLFEFTTKDATERYLSLIERFKNIERIIPQYQIATMLSITPIQLSRIRKKLKEQEIY